MALTDSGQIPRVHWGHDVDFHASAVDRCVGFTLSGMKEATNKTQVRWKPWLTTQNWIQLVVFCGREGGGMELAGAEKSPHRSELGLD